MFDLYRLRLPVACMLFGVLAHAYGAHAAAVEYRDDPEMRVVKFGDLDLGRDAGVARLYSRISSAARAVCEPVEETYIKLLRARIDCSQDAIARAVGDVNSPALTSYYLQRSKSPANGDTR